MSGEKVHGWALVLFAAMVPLGEGAAFAGLGLLVLTTWWQRRHLAWRALAESQTVLALALWLAVGLATLLAGREGVLRAAELGRWSPLVALPLVVLAASAVERRWLERAGVAFVAVLALASLFALAQYVFDIRPGEALVRAGSSVASQGRVPGQSRAVAGGFYFHRLVMAHVLLVGIGLLVARQIFARPSHTRRLAELALLTLFSVVLTLTFTRAAMLAAAVGALACLVFAPPRFKWGVPLALLLAGAVALAVPPVRARLASIAGSEASSVRGFLWGHAAEVVADYPLGIGLGNEPSLIGRYYDVSHPFFSVRTYSHSVVLTALVETGPLGLVAQVWMWAAFVVLCARTLRRRPPSEEMVAAAFGLIGVVSLWSVGLTHDVLFHKPVAFAFAALLGGVIAYLRAYRRR